MSIYASAGDSKKFPVHPEGPVAARCTRIIDLGTQAGEYQGKPKVARKVLFVWESSEVNGDDAGEYAGKPLLITNRYTLSLGDKAALRKVLEGWRGRKFTKEELDRFDIKAVLGKPCLITIVHNNDGDKTYANISTLSQLPKQMTAPAAVGELLLLSLDPEYFDQEVFDKLSDNLKETIAKSPEYQAIKGGKPQTKSGPAIDDDDIPF